MMKRIFFMVLLLLSGLVAKGQVYNGKLVSSLDQSPISGATISVVGAKMMATSDAGGVFRLSGVSDQQVIQVSHIAYRLVQIKMGDLREKDLVLMDPVLETLDAVTVSTGYQSLDSRNAVGSVNVVSRDLLNRTVGNNILERLADNVPGLVFNRGQSGAGNAVSIRGQSTFSANPNPLIILDNFPFEGDLSAINPDDIESISILKDATASSIWGARAGNGVIVMTSKKGLKGSAAVVVQSFYSLGQVPDPNYVPQMSVADFIATERQLFAANFYRSMETSLAKEPLSPVVELLIAHRGGGMSSEELENSIALLAKGNLRRDIGEYLMRGSSNRNFGMSISGATEKNNYFISASHNQSRSSFIGNEDSRLTVNLRNTYQALSSRLKLNVALMYTANSGQRNAVDVARMSSSQLMYPYASLYDTNGRANVLTKDFSRSFVKSVTAQGLLDWDFRPMEEIYNQDHLSRSNNLVWNTSLDFQAHKDLKLSLLYQNTKVWSTLKDFYAEGSYYVRSLVNQYSSIASGKLKQNIPYGAIVKNKDVEQGSDQFRAQLNYSNDFGASHRLDLLAGGEISDKQSNTRGSQLYGYNELLGVAQTVDHATAFPLFQNPNTLLSIPSDMSVGKEIDRFISYYLNSNYSFRSTWFLNASVRVDKSNLFGVDYNNKSQPLWSVGAAWKVIKDNSVRKSFLQDLKVRAGYGYSGNISKSVTAYTTALYLDGQGAQPKLPYANILNPPNPALTWEKVGMFNLGVDFSTNLLGLKGSIDAYVKNSEDLIGETILAPSTGNLSFKGNTASMRTRGLDLNLSVNWLKGVIGWRSNLNAAIQKEVVGAYSIKSSPSSYIELGSGYLTLPLQGKPLYGIYSYPFAGLDNSGNPLGLVDGVPSTDYAKIKASTTVDNMVFNGNARPTNFGALRNEFTFKDFMLGVNVNYRLGYVVRRPSVVYGNNKGLGTHGDYQYRWRNPGDELVTNVPSVPLVANTARDNFYTYSDFLVSSGDHIRLQDISLSYNYVPQFSKIGVKKVRLALLCSNVTLLYRADKVLKDPDYIFIAPVRTFSANVNINF